MKFNKKQKHELLPSWEYAKQIFDEKKCDYVIAYYPTSDGYYWQYKIYLKNGSTASDQYKFKFRVYDDCVKYARSHAQGVYLLNINKLLYEGYIASDK